MGIAQRARDSIRSIWSHGEEEEFERREAEEPDAYEPEARSDRPSDRSPDRSSGRAEPPRYDSAPPSRGGGGGGSGSNVRRVPAVPLRVSSARDKQIYTIKPHGLEEASAAADFLKTGSAVVINLDDVDRTTAVRIIDFMSGVCYGLDAQGHAMKLGATIFLFTPGEFEITSDEPDYNENPEFFFRDVPAATALDAAAQEAAQASSQTAQPRIVTASTSPESDAPGPIIERTVVRVPVSDRVVVENPSAASVRPIAERPSVPPRPWER